MTEPELRAALFFAAALGCIVMIFVSRHYRRLDETETQRRRMLGEHAVAEMRRPK